MENFIFVQYKIRYIIYFPYHQVFKWNIFQKK